MTANPLEPAPPATAELQAARPFDIPTSMCCNVKHGNHAVPAREQAMSKQTWVIFDPAKNLVIGQGEEMTKKQAERLLADLDREGKLSVSARVEREGER